MSITEPVTPPVRSDDAMPLNGIDHVELYVGNAAQAAYYYTRAFGFHEVAYAGLETGNREFTSHVLEQGRIRLVLTGRCGRAPRSPRTPSATATASRSSRCRCPTRGTLTRRGRPRRARRARTRRGLRRARRGRARRDRDLRRHDPPVRRARRLPGRVRARLRGGRARRLGRRRRPAGDRPHRRQRRGRQDGRVGRLLRARCSGFRAARPLRRQGHQHRVLGADVKVVQDGNGRIKFPINEPAAGQAQVADRGVPASSTAAPACSTSPWPPATSSRPSRAARRTTSSFLRVPDAVLRRRCRSASATIEETSTSWPSWASSSTATTRATCCRSSPSRSGTARRCSSRSSSATARASFGKGNFKALFEAIEREQDTARQPLRQR